MVDIPPWEQFDRDAYDYLADKRSYVRNNGDGPCHAEWPTSAAVPVVADQTRIFPQIKTGRDEIRNGPIPTMERDRVQAVTCRIW